MAVLPWLFDRVSASDFARGGAMSTKNERRGDTRLTAAGVM